MGGNLFMKYVFLFYLKTTFSLMIMFSSKKWNDDKCPRQAFHQNISKRGNIFMHAKSMVGILKPIYKLRKSANEENKADNVITFTSDEGSASGSATESEFDENDKDNRDIAGGWIYIGSHNFTPSAWGNLGQQKKLSVSKL